MERDLLDKVRTLRNEFFHKGHGFNFEELAKNISKMGLEIPVSSLPEFTTLLMQSFGNNGGTYYVPQSILSVISKLLEGKSANIVCDPWAGMGTVLATVQKVAQAEKIIALTKSNNEAQIGRALLNSAAWRVGDTFELLSNLPEDLDIVASVLPFGMRGPRSIELQASSGTKLTLQDDLGHLILVASSMKLSVNGLGLFVVPEAFFLSRNSVLQKFDALGLGITAAFALPSGAFAPYTRIQTYLVVVEPKVSSRMFVAQLSTDENTNFQLIENFKRKEEGASFELGCFIDLSVFSGIGPLRLSERFEQAKSQFGYPAVQLGEIGIEISLGRYKNDFSFPKRDNSIFVPLVGNSDVVNSPDDMIIKQQNYAQIVIDSKQSDARFVARFLNSEFGKAILESRKVGVIPKLNAQSLRSVEVFVPDLQTQLDVLSLEARITTEQNIVLGLQNEIAACRRELWTNPSSKSNVSQRLDALSSRLSGDLQRQSVESLDQWFETLPFPMASILRAWQACPSRDFKTKYEHLLHFFEASAGFVGIIYLSAFSSREQLFQEIKKKLLESLQKQNLSFKRTTFGTWKIVIEYLGKQVRTLLSGNKDQRSIVADMFADPAIEFPGTLSSKELVTIFTLTNKLRNDWTGHGGVVGQEEAQHRNEQLLTHVQKLREISGDLWSTLDLVRSVQCRPRRGLFETEVAVMKGSNSEFLKESRELYTCLDVERLYILLKKGGQVLKLLPLIQVGPSPSSAKNACYFFNRLERDGLRYVSYHFIDQPERKFSIEDAQEAISLLENEG